MPPDVDADALVAAPAPATPASATPASATPASATPASATPASATPASATPANPVAASRAIAIRQRSLAWLALGTQSLLVLLLLPWWRLDPHLRRANLVVGLAAVLPVAATGIVGAVAELKQRAWGRLVSIIALALALLLELSYGITRLALVPEGRQGLALVCAGSWLITLALLLERSLRRSPAPTAGSSNTQPAPDRSTRPAARDPQP